QDHPPGMKGCCHKLCRMKGRQTRGRESKASDLVPLGKSYFALDSRPRTLHSLLLRGLRYFHAAQLQIVDIRRVVERANADLAPLKIVVLGGHHGLVHVVEKNLDRA